MVVINIKWEIFCNFLKVMLFCNLKFYLDFFVDPGLIKKTKTNRYIFKVVF